MVLKDHETLHPLQEDEKNLFSHQVIIQPSEILMDEVYPYKKALQVSFSVCFFMKKNSFSKYLGQDKILFFQNLLF